MKKPTDTSAQELAQLSELEKQVHRLVDENRRLRLALALYEYAATVSPAPAAPNKRGRPSSVSDDDILALVEYEPKFKARYASKRLRFQRKHWVAGIVRRESLPINVKTIINRMIVMKKTSRN
jgi:hypothetical protein